MMKKLTHEDFIEKVKIIESEDGEYIQDLEKKLHKLNREFKYVPNIEFGGMYECFSRLKGELI